MSGIKYKARCRYDIFRDILKAVSDTHPITLTKISIRAGTYHYVNDLIDMGFITQIDEQAKEDMKLKDYIYNKPSFRGHYCITPKGQVLLSLLNQTIDLLSGKEMEVLRGRSA